MRSGSKNMYKSGDSVFYSLSGILFTFLIILLNQGNIHGQCTNPPTVTLVASTGATCTVSPFTLAGNTFGGSATSVSIKEDGGGSVFPAKTNTSPFSFTYTPRNSDIGKIITITVKTNNPDGSPCVEAVATFSLSVLDYPGPPVVDLVTQPTCDIPSGSITFSGLPSTGAWTLIRLPGDVKTSGTGSTATISGIPAGTYTFTVTNSGGCMSVKSDSVVIAPSPDPVQPPLIGSVTQPTCTKSTGSITLEGLPSSGGWIIERFPDEVTYTGNGTIITIDGIVAGTYTFNVSNSDGCFSSMSEPVVINVQPSVPEAPFLGSITPPTCTDSTGSIILTNLPSDGEWIVTRYPGAVEAHGTGTTTSIENITAGIYNFTVTTDSGCTSSLSSGFTMPDQPVTPEPPVISYVLMPRYPSVTGSVILNDLPSSGTWTLFRLPDSTRLTGTGTNFQVNDIPAGEYTFLVQNYSGCISSASSGFMIPEVDTPLVKITPPVPVCFPETVDLTRKEITEGSSAGLIFSYWKDEKATITLLNPDKAPAGKYFIKGTNQYLFFSVEPVEVIVKMPPVADAGPDQELDFTFSTNLSAAANNDATGTWSVITGSVIIENNNDPNTVVSNLAEGSNVLLWTVSDGVCPNSYDSVTITVSNLEIPSLITPNMDGRNDYLIIKGGERLGRVDLVIYDRRGLKVYENKNYNNSWNGVDNNGKALPSDTYFYSLRTDNGKQMSGYIVIRR